MRNRLISNPVDYDTRDGYTQPLISTKSVCAFCFRFVKPFSVKIYEKYKAGLLSSIDKAYETRRLFLKDKCKTFTIEKQVRDLDFDGLGEREVLVKIHEALVKKYHLGSDKKMNKLLLSDAGYVFGTDIHGQALQGEFVRTSALTDSHNYITTHKHVDTHKHGIQLMHSIDAIKSSISMAQNKVKTILERLFRKGGNTSQKLIAWDISSEDPALFSSAMAEFETLWNATHQLNQDIINALGHYSTAFTMDVYGHTTEQMHQEAAERFQASINERLSSQSF